MDEGDGKQSGAARDGAKMEDVSRAATDVGRAVMDEADAGWAGTDVDRTGTDVGMDEAGRSST